MFVFWWGVFFLAQGCKTPEPKAVVAGDKAENSFKASIELCRKVSKKSGKRIGLGNEFKMTRKSKVRAFVDVEGAVPGRTYTWHLSWVKPDGKEMFRKFAEVTMVEGADGYEAIIQWKKAENLHYLKETVVKSEDGSYSLPAKLNISASKERIPGTYRFQVYLDRKFLLEEEFEVLAN